MQKFLVNENLWSVDSFGQQKFEVKKISFGYTNFWTISFWKKFSWVKISCQQKIFVSEIFFQLDFFSSAKLFCQKKIWSAKMFGGQQKLLVSQNFCQWSKILDKQNILVNKIFWTQKIVTSYFVILIKLYTKFQLPVTFPWGTFLARVVLVLVVTGWKQSQL